MTTKEVFSKLKNNLELDNGFISNNNYKLVEIGDNYCKLEGLMTQTSLNSYGIAHGGYIFGLADTAGGMASMTVGRTSVTLNSHINYFKKARGSKLVAEAKCLKQGKTISTYEVFIYDEENKLIAKSTIDYCYID